MRLFELLGAQEVGLSLTESCAMIPAASVSGIYLAHPRARYFNVGPVDRDQVACLRRAQGATRGRGGALAQAQSRIRSGSVKARLPLRAVLFDAAGTLLLFREPVGETYRRFALDFGVDLPATRIEEAFRRILSRAEPMVFPGEPSERRRSLERAVVVAARCARTFRAADSTARFTDFDAYFDRLWNHYAGGRRLAPRSGHPASPGRAARAERSDGGRLELRPSPPKDPSRSCNP